MVKEYIAVLGYTGQDPVIKEMTVKGKLQDVAKLSVAQKKGYGEGEVRWYDITIFNTGLVERAKREIPKGTLVTLEGFADEREYEGKIYHQIVADRIGLVESFQASKSFGAAPSAAASSGFSADL